MAIRADTLTGTKRNQEYYSDFMDSFAITPVGEQLARVTNERAVNQSLKNLIMTNLGERLFQPTIGSNVLASLFEINTPLVKTNLEFFIETTIKSNETRVHLVSVQVDTTSSDETIINRSSVITDNEISVKIVYYLINSITPITTSFILKRVR